MRRVPATIVVVGKAISTIYCECVFVALVMQHAIRMRHIAICGLPPLYNTFPHYLIKGTIFEKQLLNTRRCFDFLCKFFCLKHFPF